MNKGKVTEETETSSIQTLAGADLYFVYEKLFKEYFLRHDELLRNRIYQMSYDTWNKWHEYMKQSSFVEYSQVVCRLYLIMFMVYYVCTKCDELDFECAERELEEAMRIHSYYQLFDGYRDLCVDLARLKFELKTIRSFFNAKTK